METFFLRTLLFLTEISTIIFAIRFKEDSKVIVEPEETVNFKLINESPRDGDTVSLSIHTMKGNQIDLAQRHNSSKTFQYKIPVDLTGSGLAEIFAKSETGAECSTIIFIK